MKTTNLIILLLLVSFQTYSLESRRIFPYSERSIQFYADKFFMIFTDNDTLDITPKFYFKIDDSRKLINNHYYYQMYFGDDSIFEYFGYARMLGHKMFIIPDKRFKDGTKEMLLFDFNAKVGDTWKIPMLGVFSNDRIKVVSKYFSKKNNEFIYVFFFTDYTTSTAIKSMYVGEKSGIIKVRIAYHYGFSRECRNKK